MFNEYNVILSQNKAVNSILKDDRFAAIFSNPDFQIDPESDEFRLINPVMSKLDKARKKRDEKYNLARQFKEIEVLLKYIHVLFWFFFPLE